MIKKLLFVAALASATCSLAANADKAETTSEPVIEMRADRIFIYPQRLELTGEETLLDILLMFPDQMQTGFESMIGNYNLRISNIPVNGNTRLLCSQIKAKDVRRVQICDNSGVAKGSVGMGRVIDINLLTMEKGAHGAIDAQYGTDNLLSPSAQVKVGTGKTDIIANASYNWQDKYDQVKRDEYFDVHMANRFSKHDLLNTAFTQTYKNDRVAPDTKATMQKYYGRADYYHDFNDLGTQLLVLGGYVYSDGPQTVYADDSKVVTGTRDNTFFSVVELNTPLGTPKLDMMLGWEGDWDYSTYHLNDGAKTEHNYMCSNNDIYLQFDYRPADKWKLTAGARGMIFHYGVDGNTKHEMRWNSNASAIFAPTKNHQIQAAYFHKFFSPAYSANKTVSETDWMDMRGKLVACNIDEWKLAYTYSRKDLTANVTSSYFKREKMDDAWTPGGTNYYYISDLWKTSANLYYKVGMLSLNVGANYYYLKDDDNYAAFTVAPKLYLPSGWQIAPKAIFFTDNVTSATTLAALPYADYSKTYAALQVDKQLGSHVNLMAQWHDIFSSRYSAALFSVQYRF